MQQYKTPFRCPECQDHYFETDAKLRSGLDFVDATCTNCGYVLSSADVAAQLPRVEPSAMAQVIAECRA